MTTDPIAEFHDIVAAQLTHTDRMIAQVLTNYPDKAWTLITELPEGDDGHWHISQQLVPNPDGAPGTVIWGDTIRVLKTDTRYQEVTEL